MKREIIETVIVVVVVALLFFAIGRWTTVVKFAGRQQLLYELVLDEQRETSNTVKQIIGVVNNHQSALNQLNTRQRNLITKVDMLTSMVAVGRKGE